MARSVKLLLYRLLEDQSGSYPHARLVRGFLIVLIVLNVGAVMLETLDELSDTYKHLFRAFEWVSVVVFTVEYGIRIWIATELKGIEGVKARLRSMASPLMIIDLLAILPFYLPFLLPTDLIFLRALRLMRLIRVLKLGRYSDSIRIFTAVILLKKEQLAVAAFGMGILLIVASSLMYYAEHQVQPAVFGSIPHSLWWAVVTLTTVGYGDAYPVTAAGQMLGGFISILGIAMFALPAGILSAGFVEYAAKEKQKTRRQRCPKCGAPLDGDHS